ncbi:portal protein [Arthrobacter phage DrManhattan]|uniref:Portal protein n=2 Tax=Manhattanvirus drmanhattan TaxID=2734250 RepID=A0A3G2KFG1_9CAUD|nr:portal protein [Arthrobacter phage DrManhattan]AYN57723.1 portal protein [Arthrobacter phage DrManhattan]QHB36585.1 portal protein [Arthrobacter phage Adolin]
MAIDAVLAGRLDDELANDLARDGRLGLVRRYLSGDHDMPYMPRGAKQEYKHLAERSITNWTPLLSDTYAKGLFVDGYRPARAADNAAAWGYWQANGLDARQSIAHRGALEYGASYTLILPGTLQTRRVPLIRPLSPLRSGAWYQDDDAEFPEIGYRRLGTTMDGARLIEVFDKTSVYTFAKPKDSDKWRLSRVDDHNLGYTPFVRFRDRLDGEAQGIIRPVKVLQDRVNEIVFSILIAIQYAAFRQRWATGLVIPEDEETGEPIEPFQSAIDRLWVSDSTDAKFGDFAQTEISGHLTAYESSIRTMAAVSQVSPNILTGDLVNLSADALAQMEASTQRKMGEYETLFGESWESAFRLAALAAGDSAGAIDTSAQVRWRDTEARSMSQTVDALGKIAQMLQVPVEALWEKIPGVTETDVAYWKSIKDETDLLGGIVSELQRQTATPETNPEALNGTTAA